MYKKILTLTIGFILTFPAFASETPITNYNENNESDKKTNNTKSTFASYSEDIYQKINDNDLDFDAFKYALKGYVQLQDNQELDNSKYLTIIDMSVSANTERFFIINMETQIVEHKSVVAHGEKSGLEFAKKFSNKVNSHQTSIGFYKTAETYNGKHGLSLRLDGLEYSNNKARERAVVIHAADYANPDFIKSNGRLGRSWGCPSLPEKGYSEIVEKIKEGSCLFIYYPQEHYLSKSKLIAADNLLASND
ncbi:murein L,D-transpeptidase catalytic domain family protein [Aureibaculum sp. 2210JD6-5]|uniref:murein L,D-transpeptidase catalytic domain family protein n=1 Tax=Aureibaculum sp. 2210JD6-5 TaxID=3103957 RepID=UPI002AACF6E4|nr:murein L,D-transpeptidase catalytic domain family protein [Aureibaculum sp. 2210JD6-5]MDY7395497.1 murein L,D-transpeptidase catalytic domain family protein [Aureibaculum sp. 2210JD6-5]